MYQALVLTHLSSLIAKRLATWKLRSDKIIFVSSAFVRAVKLGLNNFITKTLLESVPIIKAFTSFQFAER